MTSSEITEFYAKEVRTIGAKLIYLNSEVSLVNVPQHIKNVIPDAVRIEGDGFIEYVSRAQIEAIEVYPDKGRKL